MASNSGYEVVLRLWLPADPDDHESMLRASKVVSALRGADFKSLVADHGVVPRVVEAKSRFVQRRKSDGASEPAAKNSAVKTPLEEAIEGRQNG